MSCATPLTGSLASGQARKTVTVVFCDLVGFTAGRRAGSGGRPRRDGSILRGDAEGVLERHGGTVEKYIGDAVMAVFGTPSCTRTTRSERSGRRRHAERTDVAEPRTRTDGRRRTRDPDGREHRRGVRVPRGRRPTDRRERGERRREAPTAAAPGDILITRDTYQLVRGSVEVDEASSLVLKGKRMPVTAYRVASIAGVREAPRRAEPGLVGRDEQLRLLGLPSMAWSPIAPAGS